MLLNKVVFIVISATFVSASIETQKSWSWQPQPQSDLQTNQNNDLLQSASETVIQNYTKVEQVINTILISGREGRSVDGYNEVVSDPNIQQALQSGDDTQARNLIKDKLCNLGLMQCDSNVEPKRPFRPAGELIYAQPPGGPPYRKFPPHQNGGGYGGNKKIGYASSKPLGPYLTPFTSSGPSFSGGGPPSSFDGPIYNSKPPGPIYEGSHPPGPIYEGSHPPGPIYNGGDLPPYKFENVGENFHYEHNKKYQYNQKETFDADKPTIVVNAQGGAATTAGQGQNSVNSVNIHHHYHHLDDASNNKDQISIAHNNNPVLGASGNGFISESSSYGQQSGGINSLGFNSIGAGGVGTSGYGGVNSGFSGINGFGSVNGIPGAGGIYGSGVKPVFENDGAGYGGYSSELYKKTINTNGQLISNEYTNSAHVPRKQQFNKYNGQNLGLGGSLSTGYGGQYNKYTSSANANTNYFNTGENSFDVSRQSNNFGCICVPYDRCSAQDIIGRRDDLILPLDPRNLGTNIEALADDPTAAHNESNINNNNNNNNNKRNIADDSETEGSEKSVKIVEIEKNDAVIEKNIAEEKDTGKKITKRDVSEKVDQTLAEAAPEGQARFLGLGGGTSGIGNNGGLGGKKVVPTVGVSFGLPYPSGAYGGYPISPYGGGYPLQNPHFGSISPNGLNLGLINVNPLVSLQLSKNEYGDKLLKPFVNLHVTPNENLIHKVGNLFKAKKFAAQQALYNQHYHTHTHFPAPPEVYYPPSGPHPHHHYEHGPHSHYEHGPDFHGSPHQFHGTGPSSFGNGGGYGFATGYGGYGGSGAAGIYRDSSSNSENPNEYYGASSASGFSASGADYNNNNNNYYNPNEYYSRSANVSNDNTFNNAQNDQYYNYQDVYPQNKQLNTNGIANNYASNYIKYNNQQQQQQQQQQSNSGGKSNSVSFPNSRRRKRHINENTNNNSNNSNKVTSDELKIVKKRQAPFYQSQRYQQQQCGPQQVCCRQPQLLQNQQRGGQCGKRNAQGINGRIKTPVYVDGDSEFGEYPWQAAILKKDAKESVYACGGTLIDDLHIITAAHCIKSFSPYDLRVRLGEWDVNHDVEFYPYIERDVANIHIHPEYYAGTLDNDLAIIRLNSPVQYGNAPHISPACLPDKYTDFTGTRCWTTGWGKDAFGDFGKYQNILKEVDVPIIHQQQCQQQLRNTRLGYNYKLNAGFICAGGEEGKDACKGDGGGPLVCEKGGIWHVVGVVSWGIGCGQVNVPGVYVRVSHYLDWINQITHKFK